MNEYPCEVCRKTFSNLECLSDHIKTHTGQRNHQCPHCGRAFAEAGTLKRHIRTHTGERPYKCTHCDKTFTQAGALKIHIRIHTGEKPYPCKVCGKAFVSSSGRDYHFSVHSQDKPFVCSACEAQFGHKRSIKRHIKNIHKGAAEVITTLFTEQLGDGKISTCTTHSTATTATSVIRSPYGSVTVSVQDSPQGKITTVTQSQQAPITTFESHHKKSRLDHLAEVAVKELHQLNNNAKS